MSLVKLTTIYGDTLYLNPAHVLKVRAGQPYGVDRLSSTEITTLVEGESFQISGDVVKVVHTLTGDYPL